MSAHRPISGSKSYHVDDIVALNKGDNIDAVGYVDRTHSDVESHEPFPAQTYGMKITRSKSLSRAAFKQFLKDGVPPKGYVLVQWQTSPKTELVAEKHLDLLDRAFLTGDLVRRDGEDNSMPGTVVSVHRRCTLLGLCEAKELKSGKLLRAAWLPLSSDDEAPLFELIKEGKMLEGIPASELELAQQYNEGDLVIYRGWVGRIRECFDEITVRLSDNGVVVIKNDLDLEPLNGETGERLNIGSLIKTKKACLRTGLWRYGAYNPNVAPVGVVVEVRTQEIQVDWLQSKLQPDMLRPTNQMPEATIQRDDLDSGVVHVYDPVKRPRSENDSPTKSKSDLELQGGMRVRFKDIAGASVKYDGSDVHGKLDRLDRKDTMGYDMNVYTVVNTYTEVEVQWNDLSITSDYAVNLVADFSVDDEDAVFPGEIVCTNDMTANGPDGTMKPARVGIVQQVNTADRIAHVKWCNDSTLSFLETTMMTHVPSTSIGSIQEANEEVSFYDIKAPESVNRRRGDFVLLPDLSAFSNANPGGITWIGEVVDISLDGKCTIRLAAAEPVIEINMPIESTVLAFRGTDLDDMAANGSEMDGDFDGFTSSSGTDDLDDEDYDMDDGQWFVAGEPGVPIDDEDDSWSTESEEAVQDDEQETTESMETDNDHDPPFVAHENSVQVVSPDEIPDESQHTAKRLKYSEPAPSIEELNLTSFPDAPPAYDILDTSVPSNHPFAHKVAATSSGHMKAVQKEHKILRSPSSLPSGIYVRTWESRLDLIRVLFIGPVGTPYEYAPFVVDLFLGPSFPSDSPLAHFHSWTSDGAGMQGRVNPNLYEDGKICLSLLGTWQGDETKGEGWVNGKSTVLQILVSILGLVLVREPYYSKQTPFPCSETSFEHAGLPCRFFSHSADANVVIDEAGYEPLQGLSSSRLSSAVYTERTYLRARAFLLYPLPLLLAQRRQESQHSQTTPSSEPAPETGAETSTATSPASPRGLEGLEPILSFLYLNPSSPSPAPPASENPDLLSKAILAAKEILANSNGSGTGNEAEGTTSATPAHKDGLLAVSKGAALLLKRVVARLETLQAEAKEIKARE